MAKAGSIWTYHTEEEVQEHILREWTRGVLSWGEIRGQLVGMAQAEIIDLAFGTAVLRARQEAEAEGKPFTEPDLTNWEQYEPTVLERIIGDNRMSDLVDEATATEHSIHRPTGDEPAPEPAALPD